MSLTNVENQKLLALMMSHRHQILAYITSLVFQRAHADEILQRVSVIICEKFHQLDPSTDFVAWACKIAWWEIRADRRDFARSKIVFTDEVLESVSKTAIKLSCECDGKLTALEQCVERLHPRDRRFVLARYEPNGSVEYAASLTGRSVQAAYKMLSRLRRLLRDCVEARVAMQ